MCQDQFQMSISGPLTVYDVPGMPTESGPIHPQQCCPFPSRVALMVKQTFFEQNLHLKDKGIPHIYS